MISVKYLSIELNNLNSNPDFVGFSMNRRGPTINHLYFADDIILFSSRDMGSLTLMMDTLSTYERVSG